MKPAKSSPPPDMPNAPPTSVLELVFESVARDSSDGLIVRLTVNGKPVEASVPWMVVSTKSTRNMLAQPDALFAEIAKSICAAVSA